MTEKRPPRRAGLLADIALPLIAYYTVHGLGSSTWAALLAATAAGGNRLIAVTLWTRQFSWFSAMMFMFFGVGLAVAFIGGDPRFLLLKDSFSTGLLGAMFLFSLVTHRPLALAAAEVATPSLTRRIWTSSIESSGPGGARSGPARSCGAWDGWASRWCGCRWSTCFRST